VLVSALWLLALMAAALECSGEMRFEGDLVIASQADLEPYREKPIWAVEGNLTISGADIDDVSGFRCLHEVEGNLRIA